MKNKFIVWGVGLFVSICLIFGVTQISGAGSLKDISSGVDRYVDMASIPAIYTIHNATDGDNVQQITFINPQTRQRMSITFSKYNLACAIPSSVIWLE